METRGTLLLPVEEIVFLAIERCDSTAGLYSINFKNALLF
jgi:hypothetical protein